MSGQSWCYQRCKHQSLVIWLNKPSKDRLETPPSDDECNIKRKEDEVTAYRWIYKTYSWSKHDYGNRNCVKNHLQSNHKPLGHPILQKTL